ncbi:MAG: hypothetical protein ONB46_26140 [candidate division KSB1 bacterium]|nr:hypothetical protein [candidate division KSB1 bacterium]MDZ7369412.1 hypothetical protein [candidate division KSB1 bacterium]MDZ7407511.1 hypothetical protein [candidate division KSB1 bacterium]
MTLDAMKKALGTTAKMTVFRKLKTLSYRASYSHAGKYYTLDEIAEYDQHGLWNYRQVGFSQYGSLLNTVKALVCASETGYFAHELEELVQVRVHAPLLKLTTSGHLRRESLAPGYLYLSPQTWKLQLKARKQMLEAIAAGDEPSADIQQALRTFLATLNEKQRRLYAGFESMKLGHGGDVLISRQTGMNVKTIARGRRELASQQITVDRVRQVGGGAKALEKKAPSSTPWNP